MEERCQEPMQTYEIRNAMMAAVSAANSVIYTAAKLNYQNFGMGTTCVAAFWNQEGVTIVNVGDSRAYYYADGVLQPITIDHTLVNFLLFSGKIKEEELETHPMKHMLIRAVGVEKRWKQMISFALYGRHENPALFGRTAWILYRGRDAGNLAAGKACTGIGG